MRAEFDHLVMACADLDQGAAWVQSALGVAVVPGGRHVTMGTHNRLLRLDPRAYLEIIAIDPDAPAPTRPRWFNLDVPAVRERAARSPFVAAWVVRTDDITAAVNLVPQLGDVLSLARGPYRWRLAVPPDGGLPFDGVLPAVIQWDGDAHPAEALPEVGCSVVAVSLTHPLTDEVRGLLEGLGVAGSISVQSGAPAVQVHLLAPDGARFVPSTVNPLETLPRRTADP